ncbi:IGR protein motif-domain-containing protein [Hypoxylon sp. NC1633]|nr:IGR protein motif-domain-containing protein [Hypoxylon sp. NC1633]
MVRIKPLLQPQQLRAILIPPTPRASIPPLRAAPTPSSPYSSSSTSPRAPAPLIPSPTPFIPDVQTFLTVIGRGLNQHASKFPTWESLFSLTTDQLRELGVEPARTRRYLLQWRLRFRQGQYGVGGEMQHVNDGAADLVILEPEPATAAAALRARKYVVNVPAGRSAKDCSVDEMTRVRGYKVRGARTIVGPYALPLKNGHGVRVTITEGMWEDRRGHKVDGGERRRTEVRYKKRIAERREMRERGL